MPLVHLTVALPWCRDMIARHCRRHAKHLTSVSRSCRQTSVASKYLTTLPTARQSAGSCNRPCRRDMAPERVRKMLVSDNFKMRLIGHVLAERSVAPRSLPTSRSDRRPVTLDVATSRTYRACSTSILRRCTFALYVYCYHVNTTETTILK